MFVYVIGIIGSFQTFDQVFVMTQGGPIQATRTIVFDLVDQFNRLDLGGASAVAYILLVVPGRPLLRPAPARRGARLMAATRSPAGPPDRQERRSWLAASLLMIAPFCWALSTSFKLPGDVFAYPPSFLPDPFTLAQLPGRLRP